MSYKSTPSDTKSEVDRLSKQLSEKMDELRTSDGYRQYLQMQAKFPHYSLNNCLLIMAQKPDAQHVAGYTVWSSLGRHVNPGEHGIRIMAPRTYKRSLTSSDSVSANPTESASGSHTAGTANSLTPSNSQPDQNQQKIYLYFRPISVFDVSQTAGDPLPTLTVEELQGRVDQYAILRDSLIEASPVPVRFDSITDGAKGYYSPVANEIVVRIGMSEKQTLKTLAHEIGHSIAHSPDNPTAKEKTRAAKEVEAESIAYIVCNHYGIETDNYSFPYVGSWSSDMDDRQLSTQITGIKGSAVAIIDKADNCIQRHLSEQRNEIAYQLPVGYLTVQRESADAPLCYQLYNTHYQETKSGELQLPPQISIRNAAEQVLLNNGLDPQNKCEFPSAQLQEDIVQTRQNAIHRMH